MANNSLSQLSSRLQARWKRNAVIFLKVADFVSRHRSEANDSDQKNLHGGFRVTSISILDYLSTLLIPYRSTADECL